ncbi:hypothetical protein L6164_003950 [Bauhinia variegata]|uniref:Uncharacterized protein n=1 Tax=Bauhinia variegata TaxID=167791 RepID=A0ACB9Q2W7_BAUVA|nr:hypothetical protein L6164_003950 [Bauhinia variegata]
MANPSLLQSSTSSFLVQFRVFPPPSSAARFLLGNRNGDAVVSVKATVARTKLVEKTEAEKMFRLKTTYSRKIVPCSWKSSPTPLYTRSLKLRRLWSTMASEMLPTAQNAKGLDAEMNDLAIITGKRPVKTRARVSIATFKFGEGRPLGIAVTLRGNIMFSFLN